MKAQGWAANCEGKALITVGPWCARHENGQPRVQKLRLCNVSSRHENIDMRQKGNKGERKEGKCCHVQKDKRCSIKA